MNSDFKGFYKQNYSYVYAIVRSYINRKEDVEEIISDVFIDIWKIFDNLEYQANVKALIYTITKRRISDFLRKYYKFKDFEVAVSEEYFQNISQKTSEASDTAEYPNLILNELVAGLKEQAKQLFELKYKLKLSNREIAQKLNISVNNVKVNHNRLIKKLKELWIINKQTI